MTYIDGFVLAVPTANKQAFIDHANWVDAVFKEYGALRILECWGDDVPDGEMTDFRKAVNATEDETVVFAWIEWPNKETRDTGNAQIEEMMKTDERFDERNNPVPFDGSRMIFGGFQSIVEI